MLARIGRQTMLTHSSGIADFWLRHPEARLTLNKGQLFHSYEDLIKLAVSEPLAFATGTSFEYSNAGYALLTAVIERASGETYGEFIQKRILAPLGMHGTGYGGRLPIIGYVRTVTPASPQGEWQNKGSQDLSIYGGFGGIYSTLDDMLIWSRALETDRILSGASRAAMFTDYGFDYGFGWRFAPKFGRKLIWHTGAFADAGFASVFDRFPEEQLTVILMTNNTGLTESTATLLIEGKVTTFPANAARKAVEVVERLYFDREP